MFDRNIWLASFEVYVRNWKWVLGYIGFAVGFALLDDLLNVNSGTSIVLKVLMSTFLAIPAHIAVLTQLDQDQVGVWFKDRPKAFSSFFGRCLLLGLVGGIAPVLVVILLAVNDFHVGVAMLGMLVVWLFSGCATFAKWGTMLPAIIADDEKTFAAAGQRGSKVFGYAFPRLLISFGLLTVLLAAVLIPVALLLGIDDQTQALDVMPVIVLGAAMVAYQIVMTSVVLSRSYLKARPAPPPMRRTDFAFGR